MLKALQLELDRLVSEGRYQEFHPRQSREGGRMEIRGQNVLDLTGWDFFNLYGESRVKRALQNEVERHGISSGSSRLASGTTPAHILAEQRIAKFLGTERAVLFSSVNQVVVSLIAALVTEKDVVIADESQQSPVVDAAHLVHADVLPFSARNPETLRKALEQAREYGQSYLFLESLSPVTGEAVDLGALLALTAATEVNVAVDESYSLGILGARGAGGLEICRGTHQVPIIYGSLSRALGAYGAFVAGPKLLIDYLINRSKTFMTENVIPAGICAAVEEIVNIVELQTGGREHLKSLAGALRQGLLEAGIVVHAADESPIVAFSMTNHHVAGELCSALFKKGYFVESLPSGRPLDQSCYIRMMMNIAHTRADIDRLLPVLVEIYRRIES